MLKLLETNTPIVAMIVSGTAIRIELGIFLSNNKLCGAWLFPGVLLKNDTSEAAAFELTNRMDRVVTYPPLDTIKSF